MALVDKTSTSTASTSEADSTLPAPAPAPTPSVQATDWNNDAVETALPAKNDIPTKDVGRCVKLAPPYSNELEGHKFSNKEICDDSAQKTNRRRAEPKNGHAPKKPPTGTVETNPDDITVEKVPNYDEPNGYEIVGRPRDTKPTARTTEEKEKGSRARKMVERHMDDSVEKIHGDKPTTGQSFDKMKTQLPPMSPHSALLFGAKVLVGLGHLAQHNRITVGQKPYADAYSAGFAHAYDGTGDGPAAYAEKNQDPKELRAYEAGRNAWSNMRRHEKEEFRTGQSVKTGIPLDELDGADVRESLQESWEAGRMGLYRGRDE